jgi:RHS repeat-associated protein
MRRAIAGLVCLVVYLAVNMADIRTASAGDPLAQGDAPATGKPIGSSLGSASQVGTGGALLRTYPIALPAGRGGVSPKLTFSYSSQAGQSPYLGYGWSFDLGRLTRGGVRNAPLPALSYQPSAERFSQERYGFSVWGKRQELVWDGKTNSRFLARYESHWKVEPGPEGVFSNWRAFDPQGNIYTFRSARHVLDLTGPSNVQLLARVESLTGPPIRISYRQGLPFAVTIDPLEDRPSSPADSPGTEAKIETIGSPAPYPQEIVYGCGEPAGYLEVETANAPSSAACYRVEFLWEPRPDVITSGRHGSLVAWTERLKSIRITTTGPKAGGSFIRQYDFAYQTDPHNKRSLLTSIALKNNSGATLYQPTTFSYQSSAPPQGEWTATKTNLSDMDLMRWHADGGLLLADLDRDGLTDIVRRSIVLHDPGLEKTDDHFSVKNGNWEPYHQYDLQQETLINQGAGLFKQLESMPDGARPFTIAGQRVGASPLTGSTWQSNGGATLTGGRRPGETLADVNGDGVVDFVRSTADPAQPKLDEAITPQLQAELDAHRCGLPNGMIFPWLEDRTPCRVKSGAYDLFGVELIAGAKLPTFFYDSMKSAQYSQVIDVNGDGYADVVESRESYTTCTPAFTVFDAPYCHQFPGSLRTWLYNPLEKKYQQPQVPLWTLPVPLHMAGDHPSGLQWADLNGDGLLDIYVAHIMDPNADYSNGWEYESRNGVYLNTGTGWTKVRGYYGIDGTSADGEWKTLVAGHATGYQSLAAMRIHDQDSGWRFVDVNGDGIQDLLYDTEDRYCPTTKSPNFEVVDGHAVKSPNNLCHDNAVDPSALNRTRHFLLGRADGRFAVEQGVTLPPRPLVHTVHFDTAARFDAGARYRDMNGDRLVDLVVGHPQYGEPLTIYTNPLSARPHLMRETSGALGAKTAYEYKPWLNPGTPQGGARWVLQTVANYRAESELVHTTEYTFDQPNFIGPQHPDYDELRGPEMLGFRWQRSTETGYYPLGTPKFQFAGPTLLDLRPKKRRTTRLSGAGRLFVGRPLEESLEIFADAGLLGGAHDGVSNENWRLRQKTVYEYYDGDYWLTSNAPPYRALLKSRATQRYEKGNATEGPHIVEFPQHDERGFPVIIEDHGRPAINDGRYTSRGFLHSDTPWLVGLPYTNTLVQRGRMVTTTTFYDDKPLAALGDHGWPTKAVITASDVPLPTWNRLVYDVYANVVETWRNNASGSAEELSHKTEYDPAFHQHPVKMTDALGHHAIVEYVGINSDDNTPGAFALPARQYRLAADNVFMSAYSDMGYDSFGRPVSEVQRTLSGEVFELRAVSYLSSVQDDAKLSVTSTFTTNDDQRQVISEYDSLGYQRRNRIGVSPSASSEIQQRFEPGPFGTTYRTSDPYRPGEMLNWTTTAIDPLGRTRVVDSPGRTMRYTYEAYATIVQDENARTMRKETDSRGETIVMRNWDGAETTATFGSSTDQPSVTFTTPMGVQRKVWHDGLGQVTKMEDPDRGTYIRQFDAHGNLVYTKDAIGRTTGYAYDALGRLLKVDLMNDRKVDQWFYYDGATPSDPSKKLGPALGHRTAMVDQSGTTLWNYESRGLPVGVKKSIDGIDVEMKHEFDGQGRLTRTTYLEPSYHAVAYSYNDEGMVSVAMQGAPVAAWQQIAFGAQYDASRRLRALNFGNGTIENNTFDLSNRLVQRRVFSKGILAKNLLWLSYERDPAEDAAANTGRITKVNDLLLPQFSRSYSYDNAYRLSGTTSVASGSESYTHSLDGDLLSKGGIQLHYGSNLSPHRLTQIVDSTTNETRLLAYDAGGNVLTDGQRSFTYDSLGRVSTMKSAEGSVALSYDASGQLVRRKISQPYQLKLSGLFDNGHTVTSKMVPVATVLTPTGDLELETTGDEMTSRFHISFAGKRIATRTVEPEGTEFLRYTAVDHLGSGSVISTSGGNLVERSRYRSFGEPMDDGGAVQWSGWKDTTNRFMGVVQSERMKLYLTGPRSYDPAIGRFLQPDPLAGSISSPESWNPYVYALNDPIAFVDPSGFSAEGAPEIGSEAWADGFADGDGAREMGNISIVPAGETAAADPANGHMASWFNAHPGSVDIIWGAEVEPGFRTIRGFRKGIFQYTAADGQVSLARDRGRVETDMLPFELIVGGPTGRLAGHLAKKAIGLIKASARSMRIRLANGVTQFGFRDVPGIAPSPLADHRLVVHGSESGQLAAAYKILPSSVARLPLVRRIVDKEGRIWRPVSMDEVVTALYRNGYQTGQSIDMAVCYGETRALDLMQRTQANWIGSGIGKMYAARTKGPFQLSSGPAGTRVFLFEEWKATFGAVNGRGF